MPPPWDPNMANIAAAIDQATKMGGVVIQPPKPGAGFTPPKDPLDGRT